MDKQLDTHLNSFIRAFIVENRQERILQLLNGSKKHRLKLHNDILHELPLNQDYQIYAPVNLSVENRVKYFRDFLAKHNVQGECVAWSTRFPVDDDVKVCNVFDYFEDGIGYDDAVYSFIPGKLAYYNCNYDNNSCFLFRK